MKSLIVFAATILLVQGAVLSPRNSVNDVEELTFSPCGSLPMPKRVRVANCERTPCTMVMGGVGISEADFEAPFDSTTVTPEVKATTFGITITYKLPDEVVKDGCTHTIIGDKKCPLSKGDLTTFRMTLPVDSPFPVDKLSMQFTLYGDNKQVLFCYKMDMKVVR